MKVKDILKFFDIDSNDHTEITKVSDKSNSKYKKWVYFNISRFENAEKYCLEALENNAYLVISMHPIKECIYISNLKERVNSFLNYFYSFKKKFKLIGITGTNGKSSLSNFLKQSLLLLDKKVRNITCTREKHSFISELTTPSSFDLFEIFNKANRLQLDYLIMEVSSIAISENRVNDIDFDYLFLTNLGVDHLDYHRTIDNYHKTKISFLEQSQAKTFVNETDRNLINKDNLELIKYQILNHNELKIMNKRINSKLLFKTNLINLAYCYYFLKSLNLKKSLIKKILNQIVPYKGRLDLVSKRPLIVIDYAHTSSSFENVIKECKEIFKKQIVLVYGAGGNRDKTKRKEYALISEKYQCYSILTNDNPRSENEMEIIEDISSHLKNYEIELSRKKAIRRGIEILNPNRMLLILGKGNEDFQIMNGYKIHHNDYFEVEKCLQNYTLD